MEMRYFNLSKIIVCAAMLFFVTGTMFAESAFTEEEIASSSSANELDGTLKAVKQSMPALPPELHGQKASVQVGFIIDEKGRIVRPRIVQSSNASFNDLSIRCVSSWEFAPATKGGSPVKVRVVVPLRFK
jgi:TonB family protein